ncbi:MAG: hypothetical protein OXN44_01415 [Acidimicrobiaceae bacterium]|nr:hypothetical protein [Acidimicrobiaceae bacterium]MDE0608061.1 hypothetical protein [Acidimicrobiaceae bacterium]
MLEVVSLAAVCEIEDLREDPRKPTVDGSDQVFAQENQSAKQFEIGSLKATPITVASPLPSKQKTAQRQRLLESGTPIFFIEEFAKLDNGRRILLRDDRGWSGWPINAAGSSWKVASGVELTRAAFRVLEPDEEEWIADKWIEWVIQRLHFFGVDVDPASVHAAPMVVDFGPRLIQELRQLKHP